MAGYVSSFETGAAVDAALKKADKLASDGTAPKAQADGSGNNIVNTYLKKVDTAAKAAADENGDNIANTYLRKDNISVLSISEYEALEEKTEPFYFCYKG